MNKAYTRINWENEPNISTPLNATNLNRMDAGLNEVDNRVVTFDTTKADQSDLLLDIKTVTFDPVTGVFVFTHQNGTTDTFDLNIEKIPVSFSMDANGVITMTTADGTEYTADIGSLIKLYTFNDSSVIDFTTVTDASGNKTITADIVDGSITGAKLQPNYLADCLGAKSAAELAESGAENSAQDAEAWAVGTRGGVPVPSTDPAYENNSEYWAQHTSSSLAGLSDTDITNPQNGDILAYNSTSSKWENGAPTAGGGSKVTVTTIESTLHGQSVTLTDGVTTLTSTFDNNGVATFEGVTLTGNLTLTATDGVDTATKSLTIPYFGNYTTTMAFFSATITVTYPNNATCSLSDGVSTLTATSNPMAFNVSNTGTWTATATIDGISKNGTPITITTDGQTASDTIEFGTINLTYVTEFEGTSITCVNGGTTITKTAPVGGSTMTFYPPTTGTWVISGIYSGVTYSTSATVTSLSTAVSATLQTVPDGSTVTPTDDIQTWLNCAGIFDKTSYTTLADVLADSTTLLALMSDNNAVDYLVRSKSWASSSANWLVPTMTSNTTPSGTCSSNGAFSGYPEWKAFDGNDTTFFAGSNDTISNFYLAYEFPNAKNVNTVTVIGESAKSGVYYDIDVYGGSSTSNLTKISSSSERFQGTTPVTKTFTVTNGNYKVIALKISDSNVSTTAGGDYGLHIETVQCYFFGIPDNSTAMTDIGANNYCANTLLADSDWCSAICNSAYFESVLNVKVPTMTSNTTPSGECIYSTEYDTNTKAWKAFDGSTSSVWQCQADITYPEYLGYVFTSAIKVRKIALTNRNVGANVNFNVVIEASDSKSDWTNAETLVAQFSYQSLINGTPTTTNKIASGNIGSHTCFRVKYTGGGSGGYCPALSELQFYGREDV